MSANTKKQKTLFTSLSKNYCQVILIISSTVVYLEVIDNIQC